MNDDLRRRLKELQERNKIKARKKAIENNELLQECIEFTGAELLSDDESSKVVKKVLKIFPLTISGKVDFFKIKYTNKVEKAEHILNLKAVIPVVYILWDNADIPCLRCNLEKAIEFIDDVKAVSFTTWLVSINYNTIIEFDHEYINVGIL